VDPIQGRIFSEVLPKLEEDNTSRVLIHKRAEAFVPLVWQTTFWKM
jgi:hypothetical protein